MSTTIPIARPLIGDAEREAVDRVLRSGIIAQGPEVAAFEAEFAACCGVAHAVATTSGTTALHLALLAADVGPADEVITTPFTFFATASSIRMAGATPVFADVAKGSFLLDPAAVQAALTPRTKAVLPVQLYGEICDMAALRGICDDAGAALIEDACQAHGAERDGGRAGSFGDMGCFSFYPTKNMTTSEGGIITTDDDALVARLRSLRAHGQGARYQHLEMGFNYRLTDVAAAIGRVQLTRLPEFNAARRTNAAHYDAALRDVVQVPEASPGHVYHQYTIRTPRRDALRDHLAAAEIGSGVYYPQLLYHYAPLRKFAVPCPHAETLPGEVLSLPVHPGLGEGDCERVATTVKAFFQ